MNLNFTSMLGMRNRPHWVHGHDHAGHARDHRAGARHDGHQASTPVSAGSAGAYGYRASPASSSSAPALAEQAYTLEVGQSQSIQFTIRTQEGDSVTISLDSVRAAQVASYQAVTADGSIAAEGSAVYAQSNFQYTVQGDLNQDELRAIHELLGKVNKLAGSFFGGNIPGLLQQAGALGYDAKELASFSLQMNLTQTRQVTAAYREVQTMAADRGATANTVADAANFLADLRDARAKHAGATDLFDKLLKAATQLMQPVSPPAPHMATGSSAASPVTIMEQLLSTLGNPAPGSGAAQDTHPDTRQNPALN